MRHVIRLRWSRRWCQSESACPAPIADNEPDDEPRTTADALDDRWDLLRPRHPEAFRVVRGLWPGRHRAVLRVGRAAAGPAQRPRGRLDGGRLRRTDRAWPGHAARL